MGHPSNQAKILNADLAEPIDAAHGGLGLDMTAFTEGGTTYWDGTQWVFIPELPTKQPFIYNPSVVAGDPGTGKLLLNNADPTLATFLYISQTNNIAQDVSDIINSIAVGDTIIINDPAVADTQVNYTAGAILYLGGSYFSMALTYVSGGGTLIVGDEAVTFTVDKGGASAGGDEFFITKHPLQTGAFVWPLNRSYYVSERDCLIGNTTEGNSKTRVIKDATLVGATLTGMVAGGGTPSTVTAPILVELYKNSTTLTTIDSANWIMTDWITFVCNSGTGLVETAMLTTDHFSIKCTSPGAWGGIMQATNYNIQLLWKVT